MKIGMDARGAFLFNGTGIGTYTNNVVECMLKESLDNEFLLFCAGQLNKKFNTKNSKIYFSSGRHGSFYENFYFPSVLKKSSVDLYHLPQNGMGFNFDSHIPTVITIHDLIPYVMPKTVGRGYLERFLKEMPNIVSNAAGIITVSEYSKQDILKFFSFYPADKIYVTPLAANENYKPLGKEKCASYIKNKYNIKNPYILYIGGFSSRKNALGLIKAFASCYKDLKSPHTLVLGGGLRDEGQKLKKYVEDNNLIDIISFPGFIEESELPVLYSGCEAFVYPSYYEGFGLPPLEAMSCKAPVITSNITSIPEVTGDAALLVDPHSETELSAALIKLLNDEDLKLSLSEKGYKKSRTFNWETTAHNTLKAYKSILDSINGIC